MWSRWVRRGGAHLAAASAAEEVGYAEGTAECWFDEPAPGDRRSWAVPPAHGVYQDLDLELLDPADEDERALIIEALHQEFADARQSDDEVIIDGEAVNPRLHVAMHQVVANQLLADEPPQTWQAVQRLAGRGYDWHNIMHMIASLVAEQGLPYPQDFAAGGRAIVVVYSDGTGGLPGRKGPPPGSSVIYDVLARRWLPGPPAPARSAALHMAASFWTPVGVVTLAMFNQGLPGGPAVPARGRVGGWLLRPSSGTR